MKAIHIPVFGHPDVLSNDLPKLKQIVFNNQDTNILSLDGYINFYVYSGISYIDSPINKTATYFKRLYSKNHKITNLVRGPILVCGSSDGIPGIIDSSVPSYFVEELSLYLNINKYEFR